MHLAALAFGARLGRPIADWAVPSRSPRVPRVWNGLKRLIDRTENPIAVRQATSSLSEDEQRQKAHYDAIGDAYETHAMDPDTIRYRREFIDEPLLANIELQGRDVLEAMSGSGHSTAFLLERGARVTGLDVSPEMVARFREKWPRSEAVCASILNSGLPDASFDCVIVVGGFHHLHPHLDEALKEIHRLLRPGGYLCFSEPHAGSLPDRIRRFWYRRDPIFEENESGVDTEELKRVHEHRFETVRERYFGSVAYIIVLNSLVLRMSRGIKRLYSSPALALERLLEPLLRKTTACAVSCQWRKRAR
jgi:SAM-dependent methyltransferase